MSVFGRQQAISLVESLDYSGDMFLALVDATIRGPVVEWASIKPTDLGDGWRVQDCDGDAPFVCVARNDEILGVMEVLRLPTEGRTLDQHVTGYYESIKNDRKDGCGADYKIATEPVRPVTAPDGDVIRYGFTGALGNAPGISERVIQFAGIRDDKLVILAASANDDGGCLSREGEFTTAQLRDFEPRLALLVNSSGLP